MVRSHESPAGHRRVRAALVAALLAPAAGAAASASKKPKEDYRRHAAAAAAAPPPANGAIFQASDGYARALRGLARAPRRRSADDRAGRAHQASKSASSKLDQRRRLRHHPADHRPALAVQVDRRQPSAAAATSTARAPPTSPTRCRARSASPSPQVYPNGTMLVQGQKRVTLNRGDEYHPDQGHRPRRRYRCGQPRAVHARRRCPIAYTGKGDVARASRQGWLSRFFSVISPF